MTRNLAAPGEGLGLPVPSLLASVIAEIEQADRGEAYEARNQPDSLDGEAFALMPVYGGRASQSCSREQ